MVSNARPSQFPLLFLSVSEVFASRGEDGIWNYARELANSYRITGDIGHTFDRYDDRCPCQVSLEVPLCKSINRTHG